VSDRAAQQEREHFRVALKIFCDVLYGLDMMRVHGKKPFRDVKDVAELVWLAAKELWGGRSGGPVPDQLAGKGIQDPVGLFLRIPILLLQGDEIVRSPVGDE
jgi:hypothetical protein